LCDNFATIAVPFPCPLPTVNFMFPYIAIIYDNTNILPRHQRKRETERELRLPPHTKSRHKIVKLIQHYQVAHFQHRHQIINHQKYGSSIISPSQVRFHISDNMNKGNIGAH
jgi:hypothetical protein